MPNAIRIDGLAQFSRSLKKLDSDLPKSLRLALNEAAQLVIDDARPKVPRLTGRARASIKVASTRTAVRVRAGGPRAPYFAWLDWGGRVGRKRSIHRPFIKDEGRYLYKSYFGLKKSGDFERVLSRALVGVAKQAGLEVTHGR